MGRSNERKRYVTLGVAGILAVLAIVWGISGTGRRNAPSPVIPQTNPAVTYKSYTTEIGGQKQVINMLKIRVGSGEAIVKPVLSYDSVFGFEKLSELAKRHKAFAAVNGGFFYEYGQPLGMVMQDSRLITLPEREYPVFWMEDGVPRLDAMRFSLQCKFDDRILTLDGLNMLEKPGSIMAYTRDFGKTNRASGEHWSVVIDAGKIVSAAQYQGSVPIPEQGQVVSFYPPYSTDPTQFKPGLEAALIPSRDLKEVSQAYQCGMWLVRNGKPVAAKVDAWTGVTTNPDPRTIIGVEGSYVYLITIDGRQPGYSWGVSAEQAASYVHGLDIENAAMLDGGATTEMIVQGNIVNRPSYKGQERLMAGALVVLWDEEVDKIPKK